MYYGGSISPPRQPPLKKRVIPRRRAMETKMAGEDEKTPHGKGGDGAGGSGKGEVVRIIREFGGAANWPMLTKTNYTEWSLVMKIKMQARNLWEAIEPGGVLVQEDRMALDAIMSAVPVEMVASLAAKETALEAWKAVKTMRIGSESVRKTKAQRLRREFESIRFKDGESVDDFMVRLQNLVAALGTVGETMEPNKVVEKLLRVVPKRLSTVAVAIEVTADLATLTLEDVGGRLRAAEDRAEEDDEVPPVRADGRLYLTEEQWEARRRERREKERACSGGARHGEGGKKGGRSGGHDDSSEDDDDGGSSVRSGASGHGRSSGKGRCFNCGVRGHFSRECPKPRKEEALFAGADEEPTLL
ncbi:unnamed protein product [Urochloa humidicola]